MQREAAAQVRVVAPAGGAVRAALVRAAIFQSATPHGRAEPTVIVSADGQRIIFADPAGAWVTRAEARGMLSPVALDTGALLRSADAAVQRGGVWAIEPGSTARSYVATAGTNAATADVLAPVADWMLATAESVPALLWLAALMVAPDEPRMLVSAIAMARTWSSHEWDAFENLVVTLAPMVTAAARASGRDLTSPMVRIDAGDRVLLDACSVAVSLLRRRAVPASGRYRTLAAATSSAAAPPSLLPSEYDALRSLLERPSHVQALASLADLAPIGDALAGSSAPPPIAHEYDDVVRGLLGGGEFPKTSKARQGPAWLAVLAACGGTVPDGVALDEATAASAIAARVVDAVPTGTAARERLIGVARLKVDALKGAPRGVAPAAADAQATARVGKLRDRLLEVVAAASSGAAAAEAFAVPVRLGVPVAPDRITGGRGRPLPVVLPPATVLLHAIEVGASVWWAPQDGALLLRTTTGPVELTAPAARVPKDGGAWVAVSPVDLLAASAFLRDSVGPIAADAWTAAEATVGADRLWCSGAQGAASIVTHRVAAADVAAVRESLSQATAVSVPATLGDESRRAVLQALRGEVTATGGAAVALHITEANEVVVGSGSGTMLRRAGATVPAGPVADWLATGGAAIQRLGVVNGRAVVLSGPNVRAVVRAHGAPTAQTQPSAALAIATGADLSASAP